MGYSALELKYKEKISAIVATNKLNNIENISVHDKILIKL